MSVPDNRTPDWVSSIDAAPAAAYRLADIVAGGGSPFVVLTAGAEALEPGQGMVLLAPFHPVPLCDTLRSRGFDTWAEAQADSLWRVRVRRPPPEVAEPPAAPTGPRFWFDGQGLHLDVRGLPPPAPMVEALRLLDGLKDGDDGILLHTPQVPVPLLPELEERGWAWEVLEDAPDGALLRLLREPA